MLVLAVGLCILTAACGSDDKKTAASASATRSAAELAAAESPYCDAAREWAVAELTPFDDGDPAAFQAHWQQYLAFMDKGARLSPPPIHDDWAVYAATVAKQTPVMEKFGYDKGKFEEQATPEEKAFFEDPGPEVGQAFDTLLSYESLTCASGQPPAADVDFSGEKKAVAYCAAVAENNELNGELFGGGAKPADVRKMLESKDFQAVVDKQYSAAPEIIKDDAKALNAYWHDKQVPLTVERGYDFRKILLDGPQADREVLQSTAPEIREHYARVAAYEEQVCGGE